MTRPNSWVSRSTSAQVAPAWTRTVAAGSTCTPFMADRSITNPSSHTAQAAGEADEAVRRFVRWAVEPARWIDATITTEREPEADTAMRREPANLRAAWRLARRQFSLDDAGALVIALSGVSAWRDVTEVWGWAEELVDDAAMPGHSRTIDRDLAGS
ncbi:hypothetical protein [Pseudonocardia sp. H11422]|uniref:hypothetical protein n=1 Tax=Pseudonocardia sp. H11422 TaxID=2835866 RepID=UPI0020291B01|nr:hypothetical protein [Pseudonocardia sp. H11422]